MSRGVRSLFGPTRKSFPQGNFSEGELILIHQAYVEWQQISTTMVEVLRSRSFRLIKWLISDTLTLTWLFYWIRTARSVFTGAGLKWPNTAGQYSICRGQIADSNHGWFSGWVFDVSLYDIWSGFGLVWDKFNVTRILKCNNQFIFDPARITAYSFRIRHQSAVMSSTWWKVTLDMTEPDTESLSSRLLVFRRADMDSVSVGLGLGMTRKVRLLNGETTWKSLIKTTDTDSRFRVSNGLLRFLNQVRYISGIFSYLQTLVSYLQCNCSPSTNSYLNFDIATLQVCCDMCSQRANEAFIHFLGETHPSSKYQQFCWNYYGFRAGLRTGGIPSPRITWRHTGRYANRYGHDLFLHYRSDSGAV